MSTLDDLYASLYGGGNRDSGMPDFSGVTGGASSSMSSLYSSIMGEDDDEKRRKEEARRLREQRDAEMRTMGARRATTEDALGPDPGAVMPAVRQAANAAAGYVYGIPERVGLAPEGTYRQMQADLEDERVNAMAHGHGFAQGVGTAGGLVAGVLPSLGAAKAVGAAAAAGEAVPSLAARLAGVAGGATEGGLQGWLGSTGEDTSQQALSTLLGAGLGGAAGVGAMLPEGRFNPKLRLPGKTTVTVPPELQAEPASARIVSPESPVAPPVTDLLNPANLPPEVPVNADPLTGRTGRPEPGGQGTGAGAPDRLARPGVREAGDRPLAAVTTGVGDEVPLPTGPVYRGEALTPEIAAQTPHAPSSLAGKHYTESLELAQTHANKYQAGTGGRVVEGPIDLTNPFSVSRDYSYSDLRAKNQEAALRAAKAVGATDDSTPISGRVFNEALHDIYREKAVADPADPDSHDFVGAVEWAGKVLQDAGHDGYHQDLTTPGGGTANAWTVFKKAEELPEWPPRSAFEKFSPENVTSGHFDNARLLAQAVDIQREHGYSSPLELAKHLVDANDLGPEDFGRMSNIAMDAMGKAAGEHAGDAAPSWIPEGDHTWFEIPAEQYRKGEVVPFRRAGEPPTIQAPDLAARMASAPNEAAEREIERLAFQQGQGASGPPTGRVLDVLQGETGRAPFIPPSSPSAPHEPTVVLGSPRAVGPPIETPYFQTNLGAQTGSQEVADYITRRADEIAAATGGPQTWDALEEMAVRTGKTKEQFLARSPRFAQMDPADRARLTMVVKGNEDDIAALTAKLKEGQASDEEKLHLLNLIGQRGDLIKLAVGTGSQYGRALNSLKMEARASLGEAVMARQHLYRKYQKALDSNRGLFDALSRLDPSNPDELQAFLRHVDKPKLKEYIQEYWIGSILSGPATQERNIIGNIGQAVAENLLVRPVRAALDPVVAAAQGRAREHYMAETPAAMVGLTHGVRKGLARGFEILKRGYDVQGESKLAPIRSAFGRSQNRVVREVVGPVATGSLRLLSAADAVFKTMNHTAELWAEAANTAKKEGLTGDAFSARVTELANDPTEEMLVNADQFALKATFNDEASNIGKAWMKLRDQIPGGTFLSPFVKIADRQMARGMEYTPYGFYKAARAEKGSAAVSDLSARAAIGSAFMLGAATLAMDDRITAGMPADPAERDAFYRSGKKPWAIKVADGTWVPYAQMQPLATPLALIASMHQAWKEGGEEPDVDKLGAVASSIGQYVTDQSYLSSISKFMEAVSGGSGATKAATDLATNTVGGFVPLAGLTRSVAQAVDPRVLDARTMGDRLKAQIPVASLSVPSKVDVWGEDAVPASGRLRGVVATGTPLDFSTESDNPLDKELSRLGMPLGFVGKTVSNPVTGTRETLSQSDWTSLQRDAGKQTKQLLTELFASPEYQQADAESQRTMVENMTGAARQVARMNLWSKRYGWDK